MGFNSAFKVLIEQLKTIVMQCEWSVFTLIL